MERHAFAMKVKDDMMNSYRQKLGEIWKDLTLFLDRNQVKNFSIWNTERLIIMKKKTMQNLTQKKKQLEMY